MSGAPDDELFFRTRYDLRSLCTERRCGDAVERELGTLPLSAHAKA
jgi:hypothetical protein